jgi:HEAT repeat protein
MKEEDVQPFETVIETIFNQEPVPIHQLYRLSDISEEQMQLFLTGWQKLEDERRRVIAQHMADISEENFGVDFCPLFVRFFEDEYVPVRVASLEGMWDSTNTIYVRPIMRMMQQDESVEVRAAAAAALAHYVMMAEWGEIPQKISPPIIEALLEAYDDAETAVSIKRAALEALAASNHPRIESMIREAYEDDDPEMQVSAVFAMGNTANTRWLATIMDELDSPFVDMRAEAARAAGAIGKSDAVPELAELTMDEELEVRMAAVYGLGQIGGERPRAILANILDDPEQDDLHELAEDAMEEMMWVGGELDLLDLDFDEDEDPLLN